MGIFFVNVKQLFSCCASPSVVAVAAFFDLPIYLPTYLPTFLRFSTFLSAFFSLSADSQSKKSSGRHFFRSSRGHASDSQLWSRKRRTFFNPRVWITCYTHIAWFRMHRSRDSHLLPREVRQEKGTPNRGLCTE